MRGNTARYGIAVHKTNNRFAKAFVESLGQKAKTDAIDAGILARYGRERQDNLRLYRKPTRDEETLKQLVTRLEDLERLRILENNRMKSGGRTSVTKSIARITNFLDREIRRTEQEMNDVADSDEALSGKIRLLCEYKGVAKRRYI